MDKEKVLCIQIVITFKYVAVNYKINNFSECLKNLKSGQYDPWHNHEISFHATFYSFEMEK